MSDSSETEERKMTLTAGKEFFIAFSRLKPLMSGELRSTIRNSGTDLLSI